MNIFIDSLFESYFDASPLALADIGARYGLGTPWNMAKKHLQVIGFEPDPEAHDALVRTAEPMHVYLKTVLYNQKMKVPFHVTREPRVSSILKPNQALLDQFPESERFEVISTEELMTDTLDNQLRENAIRHVDFVKVDTQGSELFILEGATETLRDSILGLEVEVEFLPLYVDQPLFAEVDHFLQNAGFHLFDLKPYYWKRKAGIWKGNPKGQIIFADALYLRDLAHFENVLNPLQGPTEQKAKILKAIALCILYGYFDYAIEIFARYNDRWSSDESRCLSHQLTPEMPIAQRMPHFRGRRRLTDLFLRLYKAMRIPHGWAESTRILGNLD